MDAKRQPRGFPTGGQFAPTHRAEADIDLAAGAAGAYEPAGAELSGDALDFYRGLNDDDRRLFTVITEPSNSAWGRGSREEVADEYAEMRSFSESDGHRDASDIAYAIAENHRTLTADETGAPFLDVNTDGDGVIDGYSVSVTAPVKLDRRYIGENFDYRDLTDDRSAEGLAAAMGYARSFRDKTTRINRSSEDAGVIPVSEDGSVFPREQVSVRGADGAVAYTGSVLGARDHLTDGSYEATDADGNPVRLAVSLGLVRAARDAGAMRADSRAAARATHVMCSGWVDDVDDDPETALQDALTDLRHFADSRGIDFHHVLDRSHGIYADEKADPNF